MKRARHSPVSEHPRAPGSHPTVSPPQRAILHAVIIACYPRTWRERYGGELADLLAHEPRSPRLVFDLARGALDAHLHPQVGPAGSSRIRRAVGVALFAALLAAAGYIDQQPDTARAVAALTTARHAPPSIATATLTEYGHNQRSISQE